MNGMESQWNVYYWGIFAFIAFSYLIAQGITGPSSGLLRWIGSYYFAVLQYAVLFLPLLDLVVWILSLAGLPTNEYISLIGCVVLLGMMGILLWGSFNNWSPVIRPYSITIDKKAGERSGLRIMTVSDIHLGYIIGNGYLKKLINKSKELKPDIILIPGDILDGDIEPFKRKKMAETLSSLQAPMGTYAVLGNHEYYGGTIEEFIKLVEEAGITMLQDQSVKIDESFYLVGRKDKTAEISPAGRENVAELVESLDQTKPIFLLDHQPYHLDKAASAGVDLMLSGHTHRGQMAPNHLITSRLFELDYGYKLKDTMHAIVSSGYGSWGPPIRIGSRSEILQIDVTFTGKDG
ncbi:metallophosphoesterase [Alkalicoccobacillus porphyridii]|uniref:Metallophosphoesterase n=2 Tax=Alkalicoccobacillus porphyridii TaxID=2597270 RepID=A0A554A1J1_9BACI|nr:metallophosphoesterase [Alkalicoccobacillus porphyridii]